MSKVVVYENVRVVCEVEWPRYIVDQAQAFEAAKRDAEQIADQIRRHVDDCATRRDFSYPVVEWDTLHECSHCGRAWEEPPECCQQAMDAERGTK